MIVKIFLIINKKLLKQKKKTVNKKMILTLKFLQIQNSQWEVGVDNDTNFINKLAFFEFLLIWMNWNETEHTVDQSWVK